MLTQVPFEALQAKKFFSVAILDFLDQQEKFATSRRVLLNWQAAKAAFIHKILCFEVFKILCGQLIDRMLENKSLRECKAPPPPARRVHLWYIILVLPVKNGPLPAELKFRENTTTLIAIQLV